MGSTRRQIRFWLAMFRDGSRTALLLLCELQLPLD